MQGILKKFCYLTSLFILLMTSTTVMVTASEPSFQLKSINITANVEADGDVVFYESYLYQVYKMEVLERELAHQGKSLTDYRLGIRLSPDAEIEYLQEGLDSQPGSFSLSNDSQKTKFKAFYPLDNQTVEFIFEYTLKELVTNYQDTAVFNFHLTEGEAEVADAIHAQLNLPGPVRNQVDFVAWVKGAPTAELKTDRDHEVSFVQVDLAGPTRNTGLELTALFPNYLTPNNLNQEEEAVFDQLVAKHDEELAQANQAYQQLLQQQQNKILILSLLGPLCLLLAILYYFYYRRKLNPRPLKAAGYVYELPDDISPAFVVAGLLERELNADDFLATLVDLVRMGYLAIEQVSLHKRGDFNRGQTSTLRISPTAKAGELAKLSKHEQQVYHYFVKDQQPILLTDLEERTNNSADFRKKQNQLWQNFKSYAEIKGLQYSGGNRPQGKIAVILAFVALIVTLVSGILSQLAYRQLGIAPYNQQILLVSLVCLLVALLHIVLTIIRPIIPAKLDQLRKQWHGFRQMLGDADRMDMPSIAILALWEEYFVYSIALGKADSVYSGMRTQYSSDQLQHLQLPLSFYQHPYYFYQILFPAVNSCLTKASGTSVGSNVYADSPQGGQSVEPVTSSGHGANTGF